MCKERKGVDEDALSQYIHLPRPNRNAVVKTTTKTAKTNWRKSCACLTSRICNERKGVNEDPAHLSGSKQCGRRADFMNMWGPPKCNAVVEAATKTAKQKLEMVLLCVKSGYVESGVQK